MSVNNKKSLFVTYLLWLFGGFFGLHQFYLRRDRHAFLMWMSCGGYFALGWIRDLWRIPEYVRDYNEDDAYLKELTRKMRKDKKPNSGIIRHSAAVIIADVLGYLVIGAIPDELIPNSDLYKPYICALTVPFAVAIGVYTVGNVGRHEGAFKYPFLGAYITSPLYIFYYKNSVFWSSLCATIAFNKYGKKWRRSVTSKSSLVKRLSVLSICAILYMSLWCSWLYFNCSVEDKDEQTIKCRDAAHNFLKSPAVQEFRQVFDELLLYVRIHGWAGLWKEIIEAFDPQGETNALKVLELSSSATQDEITNRYRKLSREWHPDRHKDPQKKIEAQEKFIEIQRAYDVLSKIRSQRLRKNKKERENPIPSNH
ncbi:dnaJ subfamily C member 22-like protein [Leptotrombidium deliense]|uniref:DnaJ homolog subfamily C member 22 n=1 Tax=Leptotrombidium deliense TaxID=299467 RepID=A0A443SRJ8_9ACAR|nr:dnaJ subfamily C member 22-like protein [Leptotrombidium deliense]